MFLHINNHLKMSDSRFATAEDGPFFIWAMTGNMLRELPLPPFYRVFLSPNPKMSPREQPTGKQSRQIRFAPLPPVGRRLWNRIASINTSRPEATCDSEQVHAVFNRFWLS